MATMTEITAPQLKDFVYQARKYFVWCSCFAAPINVQAGVWCEIPMTEALRLLDTAELLGIPSGILERTH